VRGNGKKMKWMRRKQERRGELGKERPTHRLKGEFLAFMEDVSISHKLYPLLQEEKREFKRNA
jgi:hypothetical protein